MPSELGRRGRVRFHALLFELKTHPDNVTETHPDNVTKFEDPDGATIPIDLSGSTYTMLHLPGGWDPRAPEYLDDFISRLWHYDVRRKEWTYDRATFLRLERYLRKLGKIELANRVRLHWHELERGQAGFWRRLWYYFLKYTTGYGTNLVPAAFLAVLFWVVGELIVWDKVLWPTAVQYACRGMAGMLAALVLEALRRRLWST